MDMFRNSQEMASKEIEEQLNVFCKAQADIALSSSINSSRYEDRGSSLFKEEESSAEDFESLSPAVFNEMEIAVRQKY